VPYLVDTMVDLKSPSAWWQKQTYWDQNTKAAIPLVFAISLVVRTIPLALLFVLLRGGDAPGWAVLAFALGVRLCSAWVVLGVALQSGAGLRSSWLIPIKDVLSLFWFVRAYFKRSVSWRGVEMTLTSDGRLSPLASGRSV
jgi:ceramide glucosyltransferase